MVTGRVVRRLAPGAIAMGLAAALVALSSGRDVPAAQSAGWRIISKDGTRALPTVTVNNLDFVNLEDLAKTFGLTLKEDRLAGGMIASSGRRTIIVTPDQPVVSVGGRLVSLTSAPSRQGNRWLVPLDFVPRAVAPTLETRIDIRRSTRLLVVGDLRVPHVEVRVESGAGGATITLESTPATAPRVIADSGRLTVAFDADALDLAIPSVASRDFVQAIQPGEVPGNLRILTGPRYALHRSTTAPADGGTSRLTLELLPASAASAPGAPMAPPSSTAAATTAPAPVAALDPLPLPPTTPGIRTVVLDPGHGGDDAGARGPGGTIEKDVTLSIARRLKTLIEARLGLRVVLTRDDDQAMALDHRAASANSQRADAFISLHANLALRPTLKGPEVYFVTEEGVDAASREAPVAPAVTLPSLGGGTRTIQLVPWEAAQLRYITASAAFARNLEEALRARLGTPETPVRPAPFRVLAGAGMPAVLIEVGYLSHPDEERALGNADYQEQLASAVLDGVAAFRSLVERNGIMTFRE